MIIKNIKPPVWDEVHKYFEIDDNHTLFMYDGVLYNPGNVSMKQEYIEHESVHEIQQKQVGGAKRWWELYLTDSVFRCTQEAEAYGKQLAYFCSVESDRNKRIKYLWKLAEILSSPMYKVSMTHTDARQAIKDKAKQYGYMA